MKPTGLIGTTAEDVTLTREEKRAAYNKAYFSRPEVIERNREKSMEQYRKKKLDTTSRRFDEHSIEELLCIAVKKCNARGIDFETKRAAFIEVFQILHSPDTI